MASGVDLSGMSGSPSFQGGAGGSSSSDLTSAFRNAFDSSGWTVATGGSKANGGELSNPWLIGGLVVAIVAGAWLISRKK